jgi:hypothetical protein
MAKQRSATLTLPAVGAAGASFDLSSLPPSTRYFGLAVLNVTATSPAYLLDWDAEGEVYRETVWVVSIDPGNPTLWFQHDLEDQPDLRVHVPGGTDDIRYCVVSLDDEEQV